MGLRVGWPSDGGEWFQSRLGQLGVGVHCGAAYKMGDAFQRMRGAAVRGTVLTISSFGVSQVIRLISSLLLARMLLPDAFGLMALVNAFMQGMEMLTDFGVSANIIQSRRGQDPVFLRTAWTVQILRSVVLWGVCASLAGPVAAFFAAHDQRSSNH